MDYAKLVKELREKMLLSQTELGALLGVSFVTINRWENGKHFPTIKAKRKLHELFVKMGIEEK